MNNEEELEKLISILQHLRGDEVKISWQEAVRNSKFSFYLNGCANAFFNLEDDQYFSITEDTEAKEFDFKVAGLFKIDKALMSKLEPFINEDAFTKNHFETLKKIDLFEKMSYDFYERNILLVKSELTDKEIFSHHYPQKKCFFIGHKFSHETRQKFRLELVESKSARIECERCKTKFSLYQMENMTPPLHQIIFTYPSFVFYKFMNPASETTQVQFIDNANGFSLNVGYLVVGLMIGLIFGGLFF